MNRWMVALGCCMAAGTFSMNAVAQERIYRCGNEYTNSAVVAKQRNCQVVDGGHVTVVHTGGGSAGGKPADAKPAAASSRSAVQVDANQQKARDNDARAILQGELKKAQDKLSALQTEYNDGNPTKTALELRNPQVFNERLEALKNSITRQEADVAGIQRELARHGGG